MDRPVRAAADFRLVRAAVFAAVYILLSDLGHGVAAGTPVGGGTLAAGWLAAMCVGVPLAGRRRSLRGITTGLAVGQLGLHLMFCLAQCSSAPSESTAYEEHGVLALAARLVCAGGCPPARRRPTRRSSYGRPASHRPQPRAPRRRRPAGGWCPGRRCRGGRRPARWAVALLIWKYGNIEEKWSAGLRPAEPDEG